MSEKLVQRERSEPPARFSPEDVGYWFFRLNGCLTTRNFVVHPEDHGGQRTDADLLALRFPFRLEQGMLDDDFFTTRPCPMLMFVEIKSGKCQFNGPWTNPGAENLPRVLEAVGAFPTPERRHVAEDLYRAGMYQSSDYEVYLVALGNQADDALKTTLPRAQQVTWDQVLRFMFHRFVLYGNRKATILNGTTAVRSSMTSHKGQGGTPAALQLRCAQHFCFRPLCHSREPVERHRQCAVTLRFTLRPCSME